MSNRTPDMWSYRVGAWRGFVAGCAMCPVWIVIYRMFL